MLFWCIAAVVLAAALKWGIDHRRWAFEYYTPLRFYSDIERGFYWGNKCLTGGFLGRTNRWLINPPSRGACSGWTTRRFAWAR